MGNSDNQPDLALQKEADLNEKSTDYHVASMARGMLIGYFATYGEKAEQRMVEDLEFRQVMWDASMSTLAAIAAVFTCTEEGVLSVSVAGELVANASQDISEVASLRIYAFRNLIPEEYLAEPAFAARVAWFEDRYMAARGPGFNPVISHH